MVSGLSTLTFLGKNFGPIHFFLEKSDVAEATKGLLQQQQQYGTFVSLDKHYLMSNV